jgi:hypothetical protein
MLKEEIVSYFDNILFNFLKNNAKKEKQKPKKKLTKIKYFEITKVPKHKKKKYVSAKKNQTSKPSSEKSNKNAIKHQTNFFFAF